MPGKSPGTADAVTPISLPAPPGPVKAYVKVGSSPSPCTQMLTVSLPVAGRTIVSGEPCAPQEFPPVSSPTKFTLIGDEAAAVVGSTTKIVFEAAIGWPAVNVIVPTETLNGTITSGTGFESAPGAPGFCTCTVSEPADATSEGFNAVTHCAPDAHVVARAVPLIKIVDAATPLPATKFVPCSSSGKPSTAPAVTDEGKITSIIGPLEMAIVAAADFVGSAWLVAITEIALGEVAAAGAEYKPLAFTDPHAAPLQPWPTIALATLQFTAPFALPLTTAEN